MHYNIEILKKEFEKEIWLYIDGSLSSERKSFWDEMMKEFSELKEEFETTTKTLGIYNEYADEDLLDAKYEAMIEKSTAGKRNDIIDRLQPNDRLLKLVFGGTLAAASIIILLLSNKPNPVKNISGDLLDWNPEKINNQINEIGNTLLFMKDNEAKEYFQNRLANDKWSRDVYNINKSIQKMKNEIKESEF